MKVSDLQCRETSYAVFLPLFPRFGDAPGKIMSETCRDNQV